MAAPGQPGSHRAFLMLASAPTAHEEPLEARQADPQPRSRPLSLHLLPQRLHTARSTTNCSRPQGPRLAAWPALTTCLPAAPVSAPPPLRAGPTQSRAAAPSLPPASAACSGSDSGGAPTSSASRPLPPCPIEAEHIGVAPDVRREGGDQQHPARERERRHRHRPAFALRLPHGPLPRRARLDHGLAAHPGAGRALERPAKLLQDALGGGLDREACATLRGRLICLRSKNACQLSLQSLQILSLPIVKSTSD